MIELEPFSDAHLPGVEALLCDADALRFTRILEPVPEGFAPTWLARYEDARRDRNRDSFAIVEDGEFLGLALAAKVAERCGYVREGVLRNRYVKPGRREDTEIWSRLATGWVRATSSSGRSRASR